MALLGRWARRSPWLCNLLLYGGLFAAGDAAQQRLRRAPGSAADWRQTRHVALVALTFHGNFNYVWLRALERLLPGRAPRAVAAKVLCDQLLGAPVAVLAFYTGMPASRWDLRITGIDPISRLRRSASMAKMGASEEGLYGRGAHSFLTRIHLRVWDEYTSRERRRFLRLQTEVLEYI
ncbi:mpv17-like protein isoform X3 [Paroedura picta]|uniref:mpv17-like protein isoform X3 n=1 Tax=Paroedura picta TaxID=143630 RepID=UPI0040571053